LKNEKFAFNAVDGYVFEDFNGAECAVVTAKKDKGIFTRTDWSDDLIGIYVSEFEGEGVEGGFEVRKEVGIDCGVDTGN
jgi:hypothetical protein